MKAKIFVVSQDPEVIKSISDTLKNDGHVIVSTDIPNTVVTKCKSENFDLVFVDVYIHGISYDQLITEINKVCTETEVVVVTTYAFPESMVKGEAMNISGYLIKPMTQDKIKNVTNRALRQGELARENRRLLIAVTAAKKEWEATVDAIEDPVFVTDFNYTILRANLATFRKLGKGVGKVVGHRCYEIFHCSDRVLNDCPGKRARDSGEPAGQTMTFKGLRQRLNCSVYPQIFSSGGGLVHYLRTPVINAEQQAETMTKYERLFDDARIPIFLISSEDYKVVDANLKAIEFFGYEPEHILNMDLENLFVQSLRETAVNNIINQIQNKEMPLRIKILDHKNNEKDVFIIVNPIEVGANFFIQIFVIPADLLSEAK